MQDELANMMEANLHLTSATNEQFHSMSMPSTPQVLPSPAPAAYVSQHYHHSAHQVRLDAAVSTILAEAGIDPSALFPSQIQLFKRASPAQQHRLIELWQISPPTPGNQMPAANLGNWPQTSMELEEESARYRWEKSERERLKNLGTPQDLKTSAEPYILHGYETSAQSGIVGLSKESDSAVNEQDFQTHQRDSREWWRMPSAEPIEHQYGLLQHMQMYGQQLDQSAEWQDGDAEML